MTVIHTTILEELSQTMKNAKESGSPATFIIGAGMSKSSGIPLASELVNTIKIKYKSRCEHLDVSAANIYGEAMSILTSNERRALLEPYMRDAKVNWAHIALAQMIKEGFVARVLSLNFDNLLIRACSIVNTHPAIYDLSTFDNTAIGQIIDPAVMYLHGQSYGFKRLNTSEETNSHAIRLKPVIEDTFRSGPLLSIGYSGGSDGVFNNIKDLYRSNDRFYWFDRSQTPSPHCAELDNREEHFVYAQIDDADTFMVDLARSLCNWPPLIFHRPIRYVDDIARSIAAPANSMTDATRLTSRNMRMRPEAASLSFVNRIRNTINRYKELPISKLEDLYDNQDWHAIIKLSNKLDDVEKCHPDEIEFYFVAYMNAARRFLLEGMGIFSAPAKRNISKSVELYRVGSQLISDRPEAWHNFGLSLTELALRMPRTDQRTVWYRAIEAFDFALKLRPRYSKVSAGLGKSYVGLARLETSLGKKMDLYDISIRHFKRALKIDSNLHAARNNLGSAYCDIGHASASPNKEKYLKKAINEYKKLASLDYHLALYNLACCELKRGSESKCREYLEECAKKMGMPDLTEVKRDDDLKDVRRKDWYKKLIRDYFESDNRG